MSLSAVFSVGLIKYLHYFSCLLYILGKFAGSTRSFLETSCLFEISAFKKLSNFCGIWWSRRSHPSFCCMECNESRNIRWSVLLKLAKALNREILLASGFAGMRNGPTWWPERWMLLSGGVQCLPRRWGKDIWW